MKTKYYAAQEITKARGKCLISVRANSLEEAKQKYEDGDYELEDQEFEAEELGEPEWEEEE
jgi:hypothetical protein